MFPISERDQIIMDMEKENRQLPRLKEIELAAYGLLAVLKSGSDPAQLQDMITHLQKCLIAPALLPAEKQLPQTDN